MTKYTLYIGLNDKDTKRQEVQTLEAFKVSANIFKALTGGATISEAQGIYTHDNGDIVIEKTLRCEVYGATLEAITQAADQLKTALNQESILIETAIAKYIRNNYYLGDTRTFLENTLVVNDNITEDGGEAVYYFITNDLYDFLTN